MRTVHFLSATAMVRRAKRTLYNENVNEKSATVSGKESGADAGIIKVDEQKEEREKSDTVSSISGGQKKGKKKGKKSKKDESEIIVTTAEVHVDGDLSDMDTRDLLMAVLSQMQNNFSVLGRKLETLETNLEKKLTDKITKTLDKRVNAESTKLRKVIDDQVGDLRKEFESDLDDISEKIAHLTSVVNKKDSVQANDDDTRKMNIVLRKLPESTNEDLNNKVNSLIKDGLKIRDIHVRSTERKQSFNESIPGVVVATLGSLDDKKRVLSAKASLRHSRRYRDVYIHGDQSRKERLYSANLRSLVNAYKSGDNNIRVMGSRIVSGDVENRDAQNTYEREMDSVRESRSNRGRAYEADNRRDSNAQWFQSRDRSERRDGVDTYRDAVQSDSRRNRSNHTSQSGSHDRNERRGGRRY